MIPANPEIRKLDGTRLVVPSGLVPRWFDSFDTERPIYFSPLGWYRNFSVSSYQALEAWVIWSDDNQPDYWCTDPNEVRKLAEEQPREFAPFASLIYEGSVDKKDRSWRINCKKLFTSLNTISGDKFWIVPELFGISIWTNNAFQDGMSTFPTLR